MKRNGKAPVKIRRACETATRVYLGLTAALFPLLFGPAGYQNIVGVKYPAFLVLTGGYTAAVLLLLGEGLLVGAVKPVSPLKLLKNSTWPQRFILLYLLFTWIAAFYSPWFPQTVTGLSRNEGALTITLYCLSFLLISVYGRAEEWLLWAAAGAFALFSLTCLIQLTGANPFGLFPEGYSYLDHDVAYSGAYLGFIGNTDSVAAYFCVVLPLLWTGLLRMKKPARFWLLIPLALGLAVLLRMDVLAGLAGVFGGGLLALPVVLPLEKKACRAVAFGVLGIVVCGLAALFAFDRGSGLWHELHELLHGRASDEFGTGRLYIWRQVWEKIRQRPLLGWGPDTMQAGGLIPFTREDEAMDAVFIGRIDVAHNEYLNVWYHQGVFALLSYLAALFSLARGWIKTAPSDGPAAMLGAAALAYCVQALFGFSVCITAPFFWIVLGLLAGRVRAGEDASQ